MAKTKLSTYLANKVTQLAALENDEGGKLFAHVGRSSNITLDRLRKIPTFPACFLTNLGGELNDANNELWVRQLSVTMAFQDVGDPFLDEVSFDVDRAVEIVVDALQADRSNDAIICTFESEDIPLDSDDSANFVLKSLVFEYEFDRTTE